MITKLPNDIQLSLELAAFLEQEIEPYEGEELERAAERDSRSPEVWPYSRWIGCTESNA